uniref:Uncharacterized protein n=1 Tax=Rhizophagus irregularis (strain DAOM 181602 / DAOM 197198 / MUCL 43194) TaxID=747089 RepID=U9SL55_RHIID
MSAKFNMICYIHNIAEYLIQDFTIEEITAFILSDQNIKPKIKDFENEQIIMVKGKFIGCD